MKPLLSLVMAWALVAGGSGNRVAPRAWHARADTDTVVQRFATVTGDSLSGRRVGDEEVQLLIGNVTGVQDSTLLWADKGERHMARDIVYLTGRVRIVDRSDSLKADSVAYDERDKIGRASGSVRLTDGEVEILAPKGTYFVEEKRAYFEGGLTLADSVATATALAGTYWTGERRAQLRDRVRLRTDSLHLEADSVDYFRDTRRSVATGDVFMEIFGDTADSTRRTLIYGSEATNDEAQGLSQVRGSPLVVHLRQDSTTVDTLVARAQRLDIRRSGGTQLLTAAGGVRLWDQDAAATADSLAHASGPDPEHEEAWLYGSPMLWLEDAQVSGDTIHIVAGSAAADTVRVVGNAFVAQMDSATGRIHQVRGRSIVATSPDDSTRVFEVRGNAEVLYFRTDDEGQPDGAVQVSGDEASMVVRSGEPEGLRFGEHRGTLYPEGAMPSSMELDGFRWVPENRPGKRLLLGSAAQRLESRSGS